MSEFLRMGGYAAYVWSAYGITLAVLVINIWWARRRHASTLGRVRRFAAQQRAEPRPTVRQVP